MTLSDAPAVGSEEYEKLQKHRAQRDRKALRFILRSQWNLGDGILEGLHVACCPRDPGSPKLRMVSWNLNTLRFGGDYTPQSSSDKGGELFCVCFGFVVVMCDDIMLSGSGLHSLQ